MRQGSITGRPEYREKTNAIRTNPDDTRNQSTMKMKVSEKNRLKRTKKWSRRIEKEAFWNLTFGEKKISRMGCRSPITNAAGKPNDVTGTDSFTNMHLIVRSKNKVSVHKSLWDDLILWRLNDGSYVDKMYEIQYSWKNIKLFPVHSLACILYTLSFSRLWCCNQKIYEMS